MSPHTAIYKHLCFHLMSESYLHSLKFYCALKKGYKPETSFNPFAPGDFAEKRILKLVEWFSGHCRAIKS